MRNRHFTGVAPRVTRVTAASIALVFFLASCSWSPNQNFSGSQVTLGVSASDITPQLSNGGSGDSLFGSVAQAASLSSSAPDGSLSAMQVEDGLGLDVEFDRESALLLYYVERDVLAANGLEQIDSEALLNNYFERRYNSTLSEDLTFEFDEAAFEEFITSFFAGYGIDFAELESDPEAEPDLSEEELEELLLAFFTALIEFLFTPFISFFEFIESVFTTGVVLENRLGSGAGAYQLFVRGGSIADSNTTVSFALRDLKPGVEYVVIIGYYESFYEQFDGEVNVTPTDLEAFGFGSFALEEGIDSRLTIRVDQPLGTTETNLETFLGVTPGFLNVATNLSLQPPQFLVTFGQDLETGLNDIDDPLATEPEPLP